MENHQKPRLLLLFLLRACGLLSLLIYAHHYSPHINIYISHFKDQPVLPRASYSLFQIFGREDLSDVVSIKTHQQWPRVHGCLLLQEGCQGVCCDVLRDRDKEVELHSRSCLRREIITMHEVRNVTEHEKIRRTREQKRNLM